MCIRDRLKITNDGRKLALDQRMIDPMLDVYKRQELEGGVYQMTELRYGKYFVREKTAPDGFVLDESVYGVSIEENGKTYTVENKACLLYTSRCV